MTGLSPAALLRSLAAGMLVVAWAIFAHYGSAGDGPADFSAALATAPILAFAVILLWRAGHPLLIGLGGLAILALLALSWPTLRQNVALLFYVQHLGTNLALGTLFGRSLIGNGDALVTTFAKLAHDGVISEAKARYTRQVTIAWTIFFFGSAALSTVLILFAPTVVWSVFVNLLSMPLLALMFAGEHLIRNRVLPPEDRSSIADTIRGYRASAARRAHR
ncbi:COG4648 family protein [Quatrionicoccus australiensis]|uniref:COG4648 family protein n=1 Tax=Quatrionicoccus australiensis TaxID=138118 RepID=UPI001CF7F825|nr:hypothetical protein [Quatrionicoccus australiensis]UCV15109.1 hypothetical protein KI612_19700 [Quatrionicoccus australiensis]